jgi:hypothetical protein
MDIHLIGYDMGKSGLPQPRRSMQQDMVKGFIPLPGRLYKDLEIINYGFLPGKFEKTGRP